MLSFPSFSGILALLNDRLKDEFMFIPMRIGKLQIKPLDLSGNRAPVYCLPVKLARDQRSTSV